MTTERMKLLGQLTATFARIGAFTFGGGWAMISLIEREVVTSKRWLRREEFLDLLAVTQALPGILAVNFAAAIGDRMAGRRGAAAASLGAILPSFAMILVIAIFLTPDLIENQPVVAAIFRGIRPAVVALIVAPVITTARSAGINWRTVWIPAAVALLIWSKLPWVSNPILYIALGALGGWIWLRRNERKAAAERLNSERANGGNIQSELQSGRKEENR